MFEHLSSNQWPLIFCIPLAAAAIGCLANLISNVLTYGANKNNPWGLIQIKQTHFAHQLYTLVLQNRLSATQIYEHMGPEKMVKQIVHTIKPRLDSIIDNAMEKNHDIFWENLPITVKNRFYGRAHKLLPRIVDDIVEDIGDNIERLGKLDKIIFHKSNPPIAWTMKQSYLEESNKLPLRGLLVGYFLGLGLLAIWLLVPHWMTLVAGYALLAITTTWYSHTLLAQKPINIETLSNLLATGPLSTASLIKVLMSEKQGKHTRLLIKKHVSPIIEQASLRTFTQLTIGPSGYVAVKQQLSANITAAYISAFNDSRFNDSQNKQIAEYLNQALTPSDEGSIALARQIRKAQIPIILPIAALLGSLTGFAMQFLLFT